MVLLGSPDITSPFLIHFTPYSLSSDRDSLRRGGESNLFMVSIGPDFEGFEFEALEASEEKSGVGARYTRDTRG